MALLIGCMFGIYLWVTTDLPPPHQLHAQTAISNTRILDRHGKLLYELPNPTTGHQTIMPLHQLPLPLQQATIAIEDRSFYTNHGVDMRGIVRAAWTNLRQGTALAGGSTITQQLARNLLLDPAYARQRTLERKLREIVLALKLTAAYPKNDILALYLNQTYYGNLSYGAEAAAQHLFGKPARDLSLGECALLAGLAQAPSQYNPFTHSTEARARQAQVLDAMVHAGYLTPSEARIAQQAPLHFRRGGATMRAPHFVWYVLDQLNDSYGAETVGQGGLVVTTTLDVELQDAAQAALLRQTAQLATPPGGGPDHRVRNGAVIVLDPRDGAIMALVGSPNYDDATIQGQVNGALALRQPGSAIKPLVYAAALERGWTPATTILDVPSTFPSREGRPYTPHNYDRTFHGPITLREALATSSNVATVRVLHDIGSSALVEMATRLGITTLKGHTDDLTLALGSGEVTPLELTAAYAAFANGGSRITPYAVQDMTDDSLAMNTHQRQAPIANPQSLKPEIAYLITDILSDRYTRMRAFGAISALDIDRPAAVKTGTTTNWRDNWTVGYTPDRVVGVWVGNADGQPMEDVTGLTGAAPVWNAVMLAAHQGLSARAFARPARVVEATICTEGGLLPSDVCPATRQEWFIAGSVPTRADDTHQRVAVDLVLNCRAPAGYLTEHVTLRLFRILPAALEEWAITAGMPRLPTTVCPFEEKGRRDGNKETDLDTLPPSSLLPVSAPLLVSPASGAVYTISPGVPLDHQRIELRAEIAGQPRHITFLIDDRPVATIKQLPYRVLWTLARGQHTVKVEVQEQDGTVRRSTPVAFVVQP